MKKTFDNLRLCDYSPHYGNSTIGLETIVRIEVDGDTVTFYGDIYDRHEGWIKDQSVTCELWKDMPGGPINIFLNGTYITVKYMWWVITYCIFNDGRVYDTAGSAFEKIDEGF